MAEGTDEEDSLLESRLYFDLKGAMDEVSTAIGAKDTATQSAKLVGKTASTVAVFSGKLGLKMLKNLPAITAAMAEEMLKKGGNLSQEQRSRLEEISKKNK